MSAPRRFLDVWIIESNTVYREVPFTVVADWVQQGRLLEDDMLRPSGTAEWQRIGGSPQFAPYLPQALPQAVEDQAEAMEPVALDFTWKRRHDAEDDDVDMIPLIDVSLVLLIFFMMTTTGGAAAVRIPTPRTENAEIADASTALWIGIARSGDSPDAPPLYSLGEGKGGARAENTNLTRAELLARLDALLDQRRDPVEITIHADENLKAAEVRDLTFDLEDARRKNKIRHKYTGVREK